MEASWAPNGKVTLVLPLSNFLLLNWALWTTGAALEWDEKWFRELTGLSPARAGRKELSHAFPSLDQRIRGTQGRIQTPLSGAALEAQGARVGRQGD